MIKNLKYSFNNNFVKVLNFDKAFLPLIFCCVYYIIKAIDFPIHDFSNYYFGGKFLANDNFNTSIYFPYEFNKSISELGYKGIFASFAPNTPFLAFCFLPISFLSIATAKIVFNCISTILFFISIYRLFSFYKIDFKYVLLIPILFFIPIKNNLLFGQVYFLLFYFLTEFWLAYEKNQLKKVALFLSLAILLKIFPLIFVFIFLFKKQFKILFYIFTTCILFLGISIIFTGFNVWIFYLQNVLSKALNGEIANAFVDNYQSIFMFLKRLLVFDSIENPSSFFNNPILFSGLILGFKIAIITIGFYISKKITNQLFVFSYWILASILISPYGSTYTFVLIILPFLCLIKSEILSLKKNIFIILLFLINNFPVSYFRLLILILFFGLFISFYFDAINWKAISIFTIIPIVFVLIYKKNEDSNSSCLLSKNVPILIYDYKIEKNKLIYFYWNENGENSKSISLQTKIIQNLKIKNNQVFYNQKQLTFDKSNKLKPFLIDGKTLVFLSDLDRGIGFYIIRKIKTKNTSNSI